MLGTIILGVAALHVLGILVAVYWSTRRGRNDGHTVELDEETQAILDDWTED